MTPLEKEILKAAALKPNQFEDRQELLVKVVKVLSEETEEAAAIYDDFSDEAKDWYDQAVDAYNDKEEIPDFAPEEFEADEDAEPDDADPSDEGTEPDPEPATQAAEADNDGSEAEAERVEKAGPKKAKKAKAPVAKEPKAKRRTPPPPTATGAKNRYGIYEGTIIADVCLMLEKGCNMAEIKAKHGETKYNLLHRLKREGHHLDKNADGKWVLIHKDDYGAKAKGKKK